VQNGIWIVLPGAWARPSDFATGTGAGGVQINVNLGTAYANTIWLCANQYGVGGDTIDSNNLTFKQIAPLLSDVYDGVAPKITSANKILGSSSASASSWVQISDPYVSSISWSKITTTPITLAGYGITDGVSTSRTINTTGPLAGGGALSSNLTLSITAATTSAAGSMSASDKTKLDGLTISGTTNYLAKFTSASGIGNSLAFEQGRAIGAGIGYYDSAFNAAQGYKQSIFGTTFPDSTSGYFLTPAYGTNAIATIYTDPQGIAFVYSPSIGATDRTDTSTTLAAMERLRISDTLVTVSTLLRATGEIQSTSTNSFRNVGSSYSSFWRNNNGYTFLLLTAAGDPYGGYNTLRPFSVSDATGFVGIGVEIPAAQLHVGGALGINVIGLQSPLSADQELVSAYDVGFGSQLISRHGGGYGDEAITHGNLAGSAIGAPQVQKCQSPYTMTAPSAITQPIRLALFGTNCPANRSFMATLKITQRVNSASTTGVAVLYLISGTTDSSGIIDGVYITTTPMVAGPGSAIVVTVGIYSNTQFYFYINNSAFVGAITGYWQIEVAWVGT
jgi:hypothetical protein